MVIYEITAVVQQELVERYETYMREQHIPDLLATGFFTGAVLTRSTESHYRVSYKARNQVALDEYLKTEAKRLRADFLAYFSEGIELSREVREILQSWEVD
jgi:hypothetical protein